MSPEHLQLAIAGTISTVCGIAQFTQGVREGRNQKNFIDLLTDLSAALVAGGIAFFFGKEQGYGVNWIYLLVLVCANNASEVKSKSWEQLSNLLSFIKPGAKK